MALSPSCDSPPAAPGSNWRARLPFFYGWVIVASVFFTMAVGYGVYYSFSVFFVALIEEFGWGRGPAAGVFSVFVATIGLAGTAGGALVDRFGPARVMPAGAILLALGLFATSRLTQLWEYYLYFGVVCGIALALTGWVPGIIAVSRWFSGKQGMAMGIASAGIGLGILAVTPLSQYLISSVGWRSAHLVLAGIALFGIAPQTALLQVSRPEEIGLKVDGTRSSEAPDPHGRPPRTKVVMDSGWVERPWSIATALATSRFWLLAVALGLANLSHQMLFVHQAAYLVDGGYDRMLAASAVGLAGLTSIFGKIMWGELCDRIGRERAFTLGTMVLLLGILLLVLTRVVISPWIVAIFAVVFAVGYASTPPIFSAASADVFAGRNLGSIYGAICIGQGFGSAFGSWVAGYIFDVTNSYSLAFAIAAAAAVLSATCLWMAAPRRVRRVVAGRIGFSD